MTKIEIIDETVKYYSEDVNRRSFTGTGTSQLCKYKTEDCKMCAVGRCLTSTFINKFGDLIGDVHHLFAQVDWNDDLFQEQYKGHGEDFWIDLQHLHDVQMHWDNNGLTEIGKDFLKAIKRRYK
jgi:hypothetical protein